MDWTRGHILGHGSSATVYTATSRHSGDVYALKSAELHRSEFLQNEAKILSSIASPHIISYKGCDVTKENNTLLYNVLMEYAPGGTLSDEIRRLSLNRVDEQRIAYYSRQILKGLEYLHSNGIVHCDIKGSNILITSTGAKIADFGCTKRVSAAAQFSGTPTFMAPEVARGEKQGFESDIWSFGCTVIEMASVGIGSPWGDLSNPVSVMYRIGYSGELPEFPKCLSEKAEDFLFKCLKRDPNERWTATQLLNHPFLIELLNSETKREFFHSNSPTSILDQVIWNESESESERSLGNLSRTNCSVGERIGRLALDSGVDEPDWDGESWIIMRGNEMSGCDLEEQTSLICGKQLVNSSVEKFISSRFSGSLSSNCKAQNVVIRQSPFHKDTHELLISSIL